MADNLTVGSPGAGNVAPGEAPKEQRVDDGRAELDRLRSIAKDRTGRNLDDKTLNAIVERRKAKLETEGQLRESKQSFETGRAKEALTNKADEAQTRAARATGSTQETRTADGLTERDRASVRSDPKAGPKLPPADARPTTPDQAKELVGKLLESFLMPDGQPLDPKSYGDTLKQRPPSQPRTAGQTRAPATRQPAQTQTSGQTSTPQTPGTLPGNLAQSRSALSSTATNAPPLPGTPTGGAQAPGTPPRTQVRQPGGTPGQPTRPGTLPPEVSTPRGGLGAPAGGTSLSFRTGAGLGLSSGTGVSPDGLFNAGGGLETHSSFDGMHFNWDGFFSLFLIRTTKDMQEWRKLMKELRRLEGRAAIAAHATMIALTKMRQKFAREATVADFTDALGKIPGAMKQDEVNALLLGKDPVAAEKNSKEMSSIVNDALDPAKDKPPGCNDAFRAAVAKGQVYLTKDQIKLLNPPEQQAKYKSALYDYKANGSPLGLAGMKEDARALTAGDTRAMPYRQQMRDLIAKARDPNDTTIKWASPQAKQDFIKATRDGQVDFPPGDKTIELLPTEQQKAYTEAKKSADDQVTKHGEPSALESANAELTVEAEAAKRHVSSLVGGLMQDPRGAALVNRGRQDLRTRENDLTKQIDALPEPKPDGTGTTEGDALVRQRNGMLRQIVMLDRAMAMTEPEDAPSSVFSLIGKAFQGGAQKDGSTPPTVSARDASLQKGRDDTQKTMETTTDTKVRDQLGMAGPYQDSLISRKPPPEDFQRALDNPSMDAATMNKVGAAARAGDDLAKHRATLYHDLKAEQMIESAGTAARSISTDPNLIRAVDNAVSGAIAAAKKSRGETDALMRETVAKSQGMINQLIQLLGMSRSH